MGVLVARRIAVLPVTLVAVFTIVFVIAHLSPGGPWQKDLPVPKAVLANLRVKFHADDPIDIQYVKVFKDVFLHADLGSSYRGSMPPVASLIRSTLPVTLLLGIAAMTLAVALGVPLGAMAGLRYGQGIDHAISAITLIGVSIPAYVSTPLLVVVLAVVTNLLPSSGWNGLFATTAIIPIAALALSPLTHIARYTRASVHEATLTEHVLAAQAKGLAPHVLIGRHVLRNGLTSVVTVIGDDFARLLVGTFFVGSIYGIPGMGRLLVDAVSSRDYPIIIGVSLTVAALVALTNLLADVLYATIDPRVTYG